MLRLTRGVRAFFFSAFALITSPALADDGFHMLEGHGGPVMGLAVDSTGEARLSASFDYSIGFWPAGASEAIWLEGHQAAANSVAFLGPDKAVSGGDDYSLIIWDLNSGRALQRLEGHKGKVLSVKVSPDGKLIASAAWDRRAGIWDAASGKLLHWMDGHRGSVNDVAFSTDGTLLYSASHDGTVRSWSAETGAQKRVEVKHGFGVNRVLVNVAKGWLAYGALDGGTRVIELSSGKEIADVTLDRRPILSLALNRDATKLAVGDGDGYIMVLDTSDWSVARDFKAVKAGPVWALAYDANDRLLSGGLDSSVMVWPTDKRVGAQGPDEQPFHRPPAEMENGERQFVRKCSICHSLGAKVGREAGPPLGGVFGRLAGTVEGYAYSSALTGNTLVWGEETIDALFRVGPDELTPGSKMPMQRITGAQDRADLVQYLKRATDVAAEVDKKGME
ncbi:MAG: c-type cytochrome [Hyphomicrobiales bacterium]